MCKDCLNYIQSAYVKHPSENYEKTENLCSFTATTLTIIKHNFIEHCSIFAAGYGSNTNCTNFDGLLANQNLLSIFVPGNFKPLLFNAMLRLKHGITNKSSLKCI